jgi:hypothetical protein
MLLCPRSSVRIEHRFPKPGVAGSSPAGGNIFIVDMRITTLSENGSFRKNINIQGIFFQSGEFKDFLLKVLA